MSALLQYDIINPRSWCRGFYYAEKQEFKRHIFSLRSLGVRRRDVRHRVSQPAHGGQSLPAVGRRRSLSEHRAKHAAERAFHPNSAANRGVCCTARAAGDVHPAAVPVWRIIQVSGGCGLLRASDRRGERGYAGASGVPVYRLRHGCGPDGDDRAEVGVPRAGCVPSTGSRPVGTGSETDGPDSRTVGTEIGG